MGTFYFFKKSPNNTESAQLWTRVCVCVCVCVQCQSWAFEVCCTAVWCSKAILTMKIAYLWVIMTIEITYPKSNSTNRKCIKIWLPLCWFIGYWWSRPAWRPASRCRGWTWVTTRHWPWAGRGGTSGRGRRRGAAGSGPRGCQSWRSCRTRSRPGPGGTGCSPG